MNSSIKFIAVSTNAASCKIFIRLSKQLMLIFCISVREGSLNWKKSKKLLINFILQFRGYLKLKSFGIIPGSYLKNSRCADCPVIFTLTETNTKTLFVLLFSHKKKTEQACREYQEHTNL